MSSTTEPSTVVLEGSQAHDSLTGIGLDLERLESCGLSLDENNNTADSVEQILLTDTRICDVCSDPEETICPVTGKPHRRRLICVAHDILQCVGKCVGRFHTRQASVAQRVSGDVKVRVQRRITQNPQLFLLLFYFATLDGEEDEEVASKATIEYAKYLLDILRQIKQICGANGQANHSDGAYGLLLLKSFYKTWQRYVRRAEPYASTNPADQARALQELLQGTTEALYGALKEKARVSAQGDSTEYAKLELFIALLMDRVRRLATAEGRAEIEGELERWNKTEELERRARGQCAVEAESEFTAPDELATHIESPASVASPLLHLANPPALLSDLNTSGSDLELPPALQAQAAMGPDLPPHWYVDDSGRSRPPPGDEARQKQERFLRNEFRARKAYEAALNVQPPPKSDEAKAVEAMAEVLYNAQLDQLRDELNTQPKPVLRRVPQVMHQIEQQFVLALPARLQQRARQELRDVVDWSMIHANIANIVAVIRFVMEKIIAYGAPFREETLRAKTRSVCADLESATPNLGSAATSALRFVLDSIATLREDVAQFSLMLISSQLKGNAVEYIRDFVKNSLPLPQNWESTKTFLARWSRDERAREWALDPQRKVLSHFSLTSETGCSQRLLRGALLFGTLDLLRSGNRSSANRWDELPGEALYFEKPTIFTAANTVQECTLLLLLDGTISSMLSQKKIPPSQVMSTVRDLHSAILERLKRDTNLNDLKAFVTDELCAALNQSREASPNGAIDAAGFTDVELSAVGLTIDKMTNTMNPLYISFEKKVIQSLAAVVTGNESAAQTLGLIKNAVVVQAQALRTMFIFNWEVYAPFYDMLAPSVS